MLIFLDLDGTLLNNQSKISKASAHYIKQISALGHQVVLITGRPYRGCIDYYHELGLTTPLVCDNGASIYGMGLFDDIHQSIPKTIMDELYTFSKDHIVTAFYSLDNYLFAIKPQERLAFYWHLNDQTNIIEKPFNQIDEQAPLLMIVIKRGFKAAFEAFVYDKGILSLRNWGEDKKNVVYEIYLKGVNKGQAMQLIVDKLNSHFEDTIAFGDGENDRELLQMAKRGILMKNGSDTLITISDEQTVYTNHEDGVIKHLKTIIKD